MTTATGAIGEKTRAGSTVKVGSGHSIVGPPLRNSPRAAGKTKDEPAKTVSVLSFRLGVNEEILPR